MAPSELSPSWRGQLFALGFTAAGAWIIALTLGCGPQLRWPAGAIGPLLAACSLHAALEFALLTALGVGARRARLGAVLGANAAQAMVLALVAAWLATQAELIGWSLVIVVGLLLLLLLAAAVVLALSLLRVALYWRVLRDPRVGWIAPLATLAPLLLAAAVWLVTSGGAVR